MLKFYTRSYCMLSIFRHTTDPPFLTSPFVLCVLYNVTFCIHVSFCIHIKYRRHKWEKTHYWSVRDSLNPFKWLLTVFCFLQMTWLHSLWVKDSFGCRSFFLINPLLLNTRLVPSYLLRQERCSVHTDVLVSLWCIHLESWCEHRCGIKITWEIQFYCSEQPLGWLPHWLGSLASPCSGFPFFDILARICCYLF